MSEILRLTAVALLALSLSRCSFLESLGAERTSVEAVLRETNALAKQLDDEERVATKAQGRSLSALPPLTFQRPMARKTVGSRFGVRDGRLHTGLDLPAPSGTAIVAAFDGLVAFAGDAISGYGLTVILRHARGLTTLYAHASELLVEPGDRVTAGQKIALVGETGNASGPHLHFEIRQGATPIDPEPLIHPIAQSRQ